MRTKHEERIDTIITLLRTLRDASETLQRGGEGRNVNNNPDSRILTMPAVYHVGSYRELLDALAELRQAGPRHYWHVNERYLRSERFTRSLIYQDGRYFETTKVVTRPVPGRPSVSYSSDAPIQDNAEVLQAVAQPAALVQGGHGEARGVLVRATIERWDARVENRPLSLALDFLSSRLPQRLVIPRDVMAAA